MELQMKRFMKGDEEIGVKPTQLGWTIQGYEEVFTRWQRNFSWASRSK
jgi:hypothetical protein